VPCHKSEHICYFYSIQERTHLAKYSASSRSRIALLASPAAHWRTWTRSHPRCSTTNITATFYKAALSSRPTRLCYRTLLQRQPLLPLFIGSQATNRTSSETSRHPWLRWETLARWQERMGRSGTIAGGLTNTTESKYINSIWSTPFF
jgi:hypothetical protein